MNNLIYQFANTNTKESSSLLESLGIDGQTFVFQLVGFLVLLFIMKKWVYPIFVNIIEKREADIEQSTKNADRLKAEAAESEEKTAKLLAKARKQAAEIVSDAQDEANAKTLQAEQKAQVKSEAILAQAEIQIEQEKARTRKELLKDANALVSAATEKLVGKLSDQQLDDALIEEALREAS